MITFLLICLINSLYINGVYLVTRDGMIFGFVERWAVRQPTWVSKPISECPTCMAGIYSIIGWVLIYHSYLTDLRQLPLMMLACAYLNMLIYKINDRL